MFECGKCECRDNKPGDLNRHTGCIHSDMFLILFCRYSGLWPTCRVSILADIPLTFQQMLDSVKSNKALTSARIDREHNMCQKFENSQQTHSFYIKLRENEHYLCTPVLRKTFLLIKYANHEASARNVKEKRTRRVKKWIIAKRHFLNNFLDRQLKCVRR